MFKKTVSMKIAASIFTAAMAVSSAMPVLAADNYTPISGTEMYFGKYLIMDQEANVPPVTFNYTIAAGEAKDYNVDGKKFEIYAGIDAAKVKFSQTPDATFKVGDPTYTTAQTGTNIKNTKGAALVDQVDLKSGQKYARAEVKVDFSGVKYTEPGVYRYVLTEAESPAAYAGIKNDEAATRVIDVYVTDDNGALKIAGYVMHSASDDITMSENNGSDGVDPAGKSKGYNNEYITHDLEIKKDVSGSQASKDKYFKFDVVIEGAVPGTKYDVTGVTGSTPTADATVKENAATLPDYVGKTNVTTLEADQNGTVRQSFYLSHGQSIKINGIPNAAKYSVTETEESYKPSVTVTGDTDAAKTDGKKVEDRSTGITADTTNAFVNTKNGIVPTGLMIDAAPYATVFLTGAAGVGAIITMRRKKRD